MGPIKPGDRFFRVLPRHRGDPITGWIVVTKVGRKWAEFRTESSIQRWPNDTSISGRFEIESFEQDGGNFSSPGRIFRTEEEYRDLLHREALWNDLRKQIDRSYRAPDNLTAIDILKAADALGLRLKEE